MEWGAVIAGLVTLAGLLLKAWLTGAPERKKEADNATTQQGRADIVSGNVADIEQRVDRVLSDGSVSAKEIDTDGSVERLPSTADAQRRLDTL